MIVDTPSFGEVELLNLTSLSYESKMKILEMRNHPKVRAQMHSQDIINEEGHLNFIELLKDNAEKQYLMVNYQKSIVGVIYFTDIDDGKHSAVFGVYANLYKKLDSAGSVLMESALAYFDRSINLKKISLEVYESNNIAVNLYIKFGFSLVSSFDQGGEKVLTMQLTKNDL
ncbi:conserved hypothetical protein [Psychrobacter arcticus 273-4]|uniref:N-acetyltransferase domain-containing protein n=1 Tax=Psychrobacter arcticus (strain DSM 17307 / VKM B-2377 / 273-4) TaxID=259536 RepID=Q4FTZ1_PSYA2|nr:UDP-4-amino-4,6-dideoxy-N-acetyl-beta-L-altrosamine N-acetyltransferase [Psychrobacter arcticus]AAZ18517.1 conserved hypothetical protein [Psychrobacter arcticus 273-4]